MLALPRVATWQVSLWGATLAALLLLLLVRWAAELLVPGYGAAAAVLLGLGTLVLPFSTLFFAHVLSATLGMASFCLLFRHRRRGGRVAVPFAAGALVGVAVVVEFPLAILAVALAVYLGLGRGRLVPYAIGLAAGIVPLVAFDTWAFGSPFDLSYEHAVIQPGGSGHDVIGANDEGLFGLTVPSLRAAAELLASDKGLLVLTPLALAGVGGLLALRRGAARREANLALGVCGAFLLYNSAYFLPFGGWVPGPRFLIPALPFVALGIAAALRAMPLTTLALAAPSVVAMVGATLAEPLAEPGRGAGLWLERWRGSDFTETVVTRAGGGNGWAAVVPVLLAIAVAVVLAASTLPRIGFQERDAVLALVAVFLWIVLAASGPELLELDRAVGQSTGLAAVVGLLLAAVASWLALRRYGIRAAGRRGRLGRPRGSGSRVALEVGAPRRRRERCDRGRHLHSAGAPHVTRVALSMLTLVPGISGGSERYARELARFLARVGEHEYEALVPTLAPDAGDGLPVRRRRGIPCLDDDAGAAPRDGERMAPAGSAEAVPRARGRRPLPAHRHRAARPAADRADPPRRPAPRPARTLPAR